MPLLKSSARFSMDFEYISHFCKFISSIILFIFYPSSLYGCFSLCLHILHLNISCFSPFGVIFRFIVVGVAFLHVGH
jgi:hypothetical protein